MWFHPTFRINQYYTPQVTHTPSKKYSHIHTQILKERK
jgi:hypothetical protein